MDELQQLLQQKRKELDELILELEVFLNYAPEGTLRTTHIRDLNQFYWRVDPKDTCGRYLRRSENDIAKALAQKAYDQKVLPIIRKNRDMLQQLEIGFPTKEIRDVYDNLSLIRQQLVNPYVLTDDEYVSKCENTKSNEKQRLEQKLSKKKFLIEDSKEENEDSAMIITYETNNHPINVKVAEKLITEYLL